LISNHSKLVECSQGVLDAAFKRAKAEAGVTKRKDKKFKDEFGSKNITE